MTMSTGVFCRAKSASVRLAAIAIISQSNVLLRAFFESSWWLDAKMDRVNVRLRWETLLQRNVLECPLTSFWPLKCPGMVARSPDIADKLVERSAFTIHPLI